MIASMIIVKLLEDARMSRYKAERKAEFRRQRYPIFEVGKHPLQNVPAEHYIKLRKCCMLPLIRFYRRMNVKMQDEEYRSSFETFKSNICHYVKGYGRHGVYHSCPGNVTRSRELYKKKWYLELVSVGMIDYLSKENVVSPVCTEL